MTLSVDKPLLRALHGERATRPPVWLMRQAGRYLPEYRRLRARAGSFLQLCYSPDFAVDVTLQPIRRFGFDAAILFSDILVVPHALGSDVRFVEGEGPRLTPLAGEADLGRLSSERLHEHLAPVYATLRGVARELPDEVALIGFAGAPWTLACYMVDGGGSKEFAATRTMARAAPELFARLIDLLTAAVTDYLVAQVEAGAEALQLFDSWANVLPADERRRWCIEPIGRIVRAVRKNVPDVPLIGFPRGIGPAYAEFASATGVDGLGLDTSIDPLWAAEALPPSKVPCLQGNLDPLALVAGGTSMLQSADRILEAWAGRPFVFNLGHGVLPQTEPENVALLVEHLKSRTK
ncbi:MAG: uroporphyrinogen decarboxylase [Geminicoccaceae bacterium]|nr:uroporphyrinogen decarboxylase [Geminicoccaceae bacterium]